MGARDRWEHDPEGWQAPGAEDPEHRYPRTGQWSGYGRFDGMSPSPGYRTRYDRYDRWTVPGRGEPAEPQRFDWRTEDRGDRHLLQLREDRGGWNRRTGFDPRDRGGPLGWVAQHLVGEHSGKGPRGWKRSDRRILEEVCHEMELNSELDPTDIEIACEDGEVTLAGTVRTRRQKRLAEWIADGTWGVRDVHNRLAVREPGLPHGLARSEDEGEIATDSRIEGTTRESLPAHIGGGLY